ncbi:MAG TPA: winged helix DNA-binding domain-containing protein [Acidimicrobiales bacterium]|jgi:hypothetical protein|nr:winged helix DNA-binding domain-containing protein [Acidimicrobiales bacterium]
MNERFRSQLLCGREATAVVDVVGRLLAVQAQDPRGARLAIRARSAGVHVSDVDRALTDDRSVVVTTLNRGTLHLVRTDDYWWLRRLTTPQLVASNLRRLAQEGVSANEAERGLETIERFLSRNGVASRNDLRAGLRTAGVRVEGQAFIHLVFLASIRGMVVRGPVVGKEQAFVLVRDWLGVPPAARDRDEALVELAVRYLAGHGPARSRDLAKWAGITLGDARRALYGAGSRVETDEGELVSLRTSPNAGRARSRDRAEPAGCIPPPRLLGAFDPLLLGWVDRGPIVGEHAERIVSGGVFRPFVLVDGHAVGTWSLRNGRVVLDPFVDLDRQPLAALDADAADVERFLAPSR